MCLYYALYLLPLHSVVVEQYLSHVGTKATDALTRGIVNVVGAATTESGSTPQSTST